MSKAESKLGRNPLEKNSKPISRSLPQLEVSPFIPEIRILQKIRELEIQVDWDEFYRATVERQFRRLGRFFL